MERVTLSGGLECDVESVGGSFRDVEDALAIAFAFNLKAGPIELVELNAGPMPAMRLVSNNGAEIHQEYALLSIVKAGKNAYLIVQYG